MIYNQNGPMISITTHVRPGFGFEAWELTALQIQKLAAPKFQLEPCEGLQDSLTKVFGGFMSLSLLRPQRVQ